MLGLIIGKVFCLLTACYLWYEPSQNNEQLKQQQAQFTPALNPHPKYFITVQGHIDSKVYKQIKLLWTMKYITANPDCSLTINSFEGVTSDRVVADIIETKIDEQGFYHYKIPLDKYLPGNCLWQPYQLLYSVGDLHNVTISYFNHERLKHVNHISADISCFNNNICRPTNPPYMVGFNDNLEATIAEQYQLTLNLKKRN